MFTDTGPDNDLLNRQSYRRVNTACAGLSLASSTMDVSTFRSLLHCFNSTGALQEIETLFDKLSDDDVGVIVETMNRNFLNDTRLLYQVENTYAILEKRGILNPSLSQLGRLLENEEFITSGLALVKEGYSGTKHNTLRAIEELSKKVTPDNMVDVLDFGLTLSTSRDCKVSPADLHMSWYFFISTCGTEIRSIWLYLNPFSSSYSPTLDQSRATSEIGRGIYCRAWKATAFSSSSGAICGKLKTVVNAENTGRDAATAVVLGLVLLIRIFRKFPAS